MKKHGADIEERKEKLKEEEKEDETKKTQEEELRRHTAVRRSFYTQTLLHTSTCASWGDRDCTAKSTGTNTISRCHQPVLRCIKTLAGSKNGVF